ncbi:uncharacterized protein LOC144566919 [Carex rostrata]
MARDFSGGSREELQKTLLDAAALGQLSVLKKMAKMLDKGEGMKKTIEITKEANGAGAFHFAASYGRTDICRYLIEELGFDPNFRSDQGKTPLFCAAQEGKTGTLTYLCNSGADPTCTDWKGETPLHIALDLVRLITKLVDGRQDKSIEFLLPKRIVVDPESYRGTPLHYAVAYSNEKAAKILVEHNADLNKVSNELFTPLRMSIFGGSLDCTKLLIKAGADVNLCCPLATAIFEHSAETVKCLLEAAADPNIPSEVRLNDYGMLPIEIAAECREKRFVQMLLPLTSQLPTVPNWTVEGIINYVKSPAFKKKHEIRRKEMFAYWKDEGGQAFRRSEYLAAINFYSAVSLLLDSFIFDNFCQLIFNTFKPSTSELDIAMLMFPTDATIFANRSLCWLRMAEGDLALEDAQTAKSLGRNWPKAYYRLGAAFMSLKRYEEASQVLLDGFNLDPANKDMEKALLEALDCMKKSNAL